MAAGKSSRINRQYKTKYRIRNWREYERGLRSRGRIASVLELRDPDRVDVAGRLQPAASPIALSPRNDAEVHASRQGSVAKKQPITIFIVVF